MAASVEGTATCSPALQTLSLMQARHTRFLLPISSSVWAPVSNEKTFATYFKEDYRSFAWVRDPFVCTANELSIDMQEQLIELKSDSRLKELFSSLPSFVILGSIDAGISWTLWRRLEDSPSFRVDNICVRQDDSQKWLHSKRNTAIVHKWDDLRLCLSNIEPKIEDLCKAKAGSGLTLNITYLQASVKNANDAYYFGLVIINNNNA